jgi:predicted transport protein
MHIYNHTKSKLSSLKEIPFKLEKDIQTIFETNLQSVLNLQFVKSEFTIKNNRIDTLAFDVESNSFVLIEYKRSQNYSVIDQGVSYLNLMLEYKADFIVEYNESLKGDLKRSDVDWSQTRIIFVSPSFTDFQKQSTNFKDLAIELWEVKQFENDIIVVNPIKKSKSAPSIKQVQHNDDSELSKITKEIIVYTEEEHLEGKSDAIKELYEVYKQALLQLIPDVEVAAKKLYIAFKKGKNIADVVILKNSLKIFVNIKSGELDDPKGLMRDVSGIGHWGNGDYEVVVDGTQNLEYLMSLIKQALV